MKKIFSFKVTAILLILLLSVTLVGCGGQEADPDEENGVENGSEEEVTRLLLATGGTGGTYYPLGGGIASAWENHIDNLNITAQATGASVENLRLLASNEADLAMAMNGPAIAAIQGLGDFEGNQLDFAAVGVIYPEVMQIVTPADSGIKTVADLEGKRVSVGPPGSGTASAAVGILAAYGIDVDSDISRHDDNFTDAANKIKDGQLDAAFAVLAVPAANVIDIAVSTNVNIVDIEGDGLAKLLEADPSFSPYTIPAGTYDGQVEDGLTVSQWAALYVPTDMDEDLIYEMTKVMYEQTEEIARSHDRGNQITIDNAISGIEPVPFHPGALKYYQEIGIK